MNATIEAPATTLSAQEAAIESGKRVLHGHVTPRILHMFEAIRAAGEPRIGLERAIAFTEGFQQTRDGQPIVTRWGKALLYMAENLPVAILDDELIVGRLHGYFGRTGPIWPELDGSVWSAGAEVIMKQQGQFGTPVITPEDKQVIDEVIVPYWSTRDFKHAYHAALPDETRTLLYGPDPKNVLQMTGVMIETATMRSSQQWAYPYDLILTKGCIAIKQELEDRVASLTSPEELRTKQPFLQAVIMSLDALMIYTSRYASLATEMAAKEKNAGRRQELEEIAAACAWAPANPARSFREALQVQWFIQLFTQIEQNIGGGQMSGRMDQYLGRFYANDLAAGTITREEAIELLQCVWLNMFQMAQIKMTPSGAAANEGYAHFELVSLGGLDADGHDATNELTYVILESTRPLQITYPDIGVRIHANSPGRLLHAAAETIKDGKGSPKLFNDEFIIPFYLALGCTPAEANDWTPMSCADNRVLARETHVTGNGGLNWAAPVELTLRNGKIKILHNLPFGIETGDPRTFTTFDDFWRAFRSQLEHLLKHTMIQQMTANAIAGQHLAAPLATLTSPVLMEACIDIHDHYHAMQIPGALDVSMIESVGFATAIDSIAAIKHLIYDTQQLTWDQLLDAIDKNWEGAEAIREYCVHAPKYGNGIEWVDAIGFELERTILEYARQYPKPHGQPWCYKCVPVTFHIPLGKVISATPNGRHAGEFLSEGVSASHGMDMKGPTTALVSIARGHCTSVRGNGPKLINLKMNPANVAGEEGTRRLMQLIQAWRDLKLWHIQFNIVNKETLLAAQKDPEHYRDLVVRIAGYSAYFVDLSPMQQAEIIARTEQSMGV